MKKLVLESTAPFQGLAELVAYREGLFEKEGLLVEFVDRREAAVLLAVVEDLLCRGRPDAVERVQLLERRGVQVDGLLGRRGRRPTRRRGRNRCPDGDEDLTPVLELGRAVELRFVCFIRCAATHEQAPEKYPSKS